MDCRTPAILFLSAILAGCAAQVDSASKDPGRERDPEKVCCAPEYEKLLAERLNADEQAVELQILDWEAARGLVDQHKGKVVVLDLWATYCPPCVEEFPHLVKLHQEQKDKVACISVSADFDGTTDSPESHREKVLKFLTEQKATFQNVLLSTDTESLFGKKIPHESIPVVMVFNQKGELAGEFPDPKNPDEFTYEKHVLPLVKSLLDAK